MEKQKRERRSNFTQEETYLLVSLIERKKYIIESKKSDATTWQDKEKAWKNIEKEFNSLSNSVYRDHKHLKLKYEAMKRDLRKKIALIQSERYKTDFCTGTSTPIEQKMKEIIFSTEANDTFESDSVLPSASTSDSTFIWLPAEELNVQSGTEETLRDDSSNNVVIKTEKQDNEFLLKQVFEESQEEEPIQGESDTSNQTEDHYKQRKQSDLTALKTSKDQILSKPREKRPLRRLTEEKIEIAKIQRKILTEELEQKLIQRKILERELEHKNTIHELEKQHLLLKIELLKKDLSKQ